MNNFLTNDTKVIILLCGYLGNNKSIKPLTQTKYNLLARWLQSKNLRPEDLLERENIIEAAKNTNLEFSYLESLLNRGVELGFAVEEWQRNGIWIISRSDKSYPIYYKKHLKEQSPPLLYGMGDISLLENGGICIVGSRNVDVEGSRFTEKYAKLCALNNIPVISGGAIGVDYISMVTAINNGGISIGVLAENLLKTSLDKNFREAIANKKLVLISARHPKAHFTVGAAMDRNKLIYGLSDFGLVVSSEFKKGGTWAGAEEELKRNNSIPIFVRSGNLTPEGNKKLLEIGAIQWPNDISISNMREQLVNLSKHRKKEHADINLFTINEKSSINSQNNNDSKNLDINREIYKAVLPIILKYIESANSIDELAETLDISKTQLNYWITLAIKNKKVKKLIDSNKYIIES